MGKKAIFFIVALLVVAAGFVGWKFYGNRHQDMSSVKINTSANTPVTLESQEPNDFTASFEIYTNGTRRIFTAAMYHNQSPDVYIQSQDSNTVYVKKAGVTWKNFFDTLPFSLTTECLVTGTKQTFCNTETKKLRFFLNGIETPQALDLKIQPGDLLRVTYGS